MKVKAAIRTGTPCEIAHYRSYASKAAAVEDFRDYLHDCRRFGNCCTEAYLEFDDGSAYEVGPRGGARKVVA